MGLQVRWDFVTIPVIAVLALLISHLPRYANVRAGSAYKEKKYVEHIKAANKHVEKAMDIQNELTSRTSIS